MDNRDTRFHSLQQIVCQTLVTLCGSDQQSVLDLLDYWSRALVAQRKRVALIEISGGEKSAKKYKNQLKLLIVHMFLVIENLLPSTNKCVSSLQLVLQFKWELMNNQDKTIEVG